MKRHAGVLAIASIFMSFAASAVAQDIVRDPQDLFAEDQFTLLFDGGFFTEGPALGPDGHLYFSDITFSAASGMQAGHIWRHELSAGTTEIFRSPSGMSNGLAFDREGRLVAALGADFGGRMIVRTDMGSGRSEIVAGLHDGRSFNSPNDLVLDREGRIYFTDPRYTGHEPMEQPVMGVYRADPDGTVTRISDDAGKPNGIAISPDQATLYVTSIELSLWSGRNFLLAFDLARDGSISNRRVLIDFRPEPAADGMAVDAEGNLYLARPGEDPARFGVYVYSPTGEELAFVATPDPPTNVAFGHGDHANTLFVTAGGSVYRIATRIPGHHPFGR